MPFFICWWSQLHCFKWMNWINWIELNQSESVASIYSDQTRAITLGLEYPMSFRWSRQWLLNDEWTNEDHHQQSSSKKPKIFYFSPIYRGLPLQLWWGDKNSVPTYNSLGVFLPKISNKLLSSFNIAFPSPRHPLEKQQWQEPLPHLKRQERQVSDFVACFKHANWLIAEEMNCHVDLYCFFLLFCCYNSSWLREIEPSYRHHWW